MLAACLRDADIETTGFSAWSRQEGRALQDTINTEAFDAGVYGVPTFLVEDEMWFGREHLPRIEWILKGRQGVAPDVGNRSFAP